MKAVFIDASKPTTCLLDPVPTKLLQELLPVVEEPLLNIINSSLSLGNVPNVLLRAQLCSFLQTNYIYEEFQSGPAIAQELHLLKLQITCFLLQTKAASHC